MEPDPQRAGDSLQAGVQIIEEHHLRDAKLKPRCSKLLPAGPPLNGTRMMVR
jgi:hypothetical protein